jgi:hypothetical protein
MAYDVTLSQCAGRPMAGADQATGLRLERIGTTSAADLPLSRPSMYAAQAFKPAATSGTVSARSYREVTSGTPGHALMAQDEGRHVRKPADAANARGAGRAQVVQAEIHARRFPDALPSCGTDCC